MIKIKTTYHCKALEEALQIASAQWAKAELQPGYAYVDVATTNNFGGSSIDDLVGNDNWIRQNSPDSSRTEVMQKYVAAAYRTIIETIKTYAGYPNVSRIRDIVAAPNKVIRNLWSDGVYGWCFNLSKLIELNQKTLHGNLEQAHLTERHEVRHSIHGISDSNPIGHYIMRALDATAHFIPGRYDKQQVYRDDRL